MKLKMYFFLPLLLLGIACSNAQQEGKSKLTKKINDYLIKYEETGFSGAILVAEDGDITLNKGYGYANDSTWTEVSPQTIWTIGSITKPFTAAAILKLEMMGQLTTDDRIEKHIDGLKGHIGNLTIHQLLTHTSGIIEYSGYDEETLNTEGFIKVVNNSRLKFTPGETFAYSNVGYTMLGVIIEKVSGQPYEQFLKENLFDPAGMSSTGYQKPNWDRAAFAVGYGGRGTWGTVYEKNGYENGVSWNLKGNGGILSTPEDMFKWYQALQRESIFPASVKEKMYGQYIQTPGDFSPFNDKSPGYYGYGWGMTESAAFKPIIMHGGSNDVFEAGYMYYPEDDIFFFIASNRTSKSAVQAILTIDKIISKKKYELPKADVIPDEEITRNYEGSYAFEDGSKFTIVQSEKPSIIEGSLTVRPKDKAAFRKIVGDKLSEELESKVSSFISNVVEASAKRSEYSISMHTQHAKVNNNKDEDTDISYGIDDNTPVKDQLGTFWKDQVAEKGEYVSNSIWGAVGVGDRYWVQVYLKFEKGDLFMNFSIGEDDGEIKRFSSNYRAVGLILKPKSSSKFQEVNSGGLYEFIINKSSGNVKIKSKLKSEKLVATKSSSDAG